MTDTKIYDINSADHPLNKIHTDIASTKHVLSASPVVQSKSSISSPSLLTRQSTSLINHTSPSIPNYLNKVSTSIPSSPRIPPSSPKVSTSSTQSVPSSPRISTGFYAPPLSQKLSTSSTQSVPSSPRISTGFYAPPLSLKISTSSTQSLPPLSPKLSTSTGFYTPPLSPKLSTSSTQPISLSPTSGFYAPPLSPKLSTSSMQSVPSSPKLSTSSTQSIPLSPNLATSAPASPKPKRKKGRYFDTWASVSDRLPDAKYLVVVNSESKSLPVSPSYKNSQVSEAAKSLTGSPSYNASKTNRSAESLTNSPSYNNSKTNRGSESKSLPSSPSYNSSQSAFISAALEADSNYRLFSNSSGIKSNNNSKYVPPKLNAKPSNKISEFGSKNSKVGISAPSMAYLSNTDIDNPWLPVTSENINLKVLGVTPTGDLEKIPTLSCTKTIPSPHWSNYQQQNIIDDQFDILNATIYLDCTKPSELDYHRVANKMRSIRETTSSLKSQFKTQLMPITKSQGRVNQDTFDQALRIYENNQVYYQDQLDEGNITIEQFKFELTKLEKWFLCIIEPRQSDDLDAWRNRELGKIKRGVSGYCDLEVIKYIEKPSQETINYISQIQLGLY
jgi:hypothetical protein